MAMLTAGRHCRAWLGGGAAAAAVAAAVALPQTAHADKKGKDDSETRGPLFDPEALERGAKALREINKSPNAKQVRVW
jgi:ATPase family AAA domain-containing protein 3A/B